ncbi:DENN domain-containing protein 11-like isoform X2 [Polyodon spathula]|uniref:DENN domain-containing protein 11-like isoform X2 n=1 Tax=Polyodon spathula TaxID=7913 RepID=UPI001B7DB08D|nr:DENN domain-containing protein 11-like isoform X2 [Polyodon spathula]
MQYFVTLLNNTIHSSTRSNLIRDRAMVKQPDRAPLLEWEEIPADTPASAPPPERGSESSPANCRALGSTAPGTGWSTSPGGPAVFSSAAVSGEADSAAAASTETVRVGPCWDAHSPVNGEYRLSGWETGIPEKSLATSVREWEEKDQIVAVFIVTFDTRSGNIVEWCLPQEVDLDGVEFKSMASGSHRISSDFVYFRKGSYFGLACFANMPVESALERGARMKSVGILSPSYTLLYRYMHFLENQVRHQLESPGHYTQLEAFYEDKKGVLPIGNGAATSLQPVHWLPSINKCMHPEMKITHPAGCMSQFIKFFGEQIIVLWKFALLRKRILIFSPPPVGVVCYRVYCCCCLANVSLPGIGVSVPEFRPFFYINVADIEVLETEVSYVACTTEKIFEEKKSLYDVYVDNQNVRTRHENLQPLLRINGADRDKYRKLSEQRCCSTPRKQTGTVAPMKRTSSFCFSWSRTTGYSRCCRRYRPARTRH